jgi:hypothetical protein
MVQQQPEKFTPKGNPLNLEDLERKTEAFTKEEINQAIASSPKKLKPFLISESSPKRQ